MSWEGRQYAPGQPVTLKAGLGSGIVMGSLYAGSQHRLYRVQRSGAFGPSTIEVGEGVITAAEPVPEYDVGEHVRVEHHGIGTVTAKAERDGAPGFIYTVELAGRRRFDHGAGPQTTIVGPERIKGTA